MFGGADFWTAVASDFVRSLSRRMPDGRTQAGAILLAAVKKVSADSSALQAAARAKPNLAGASAVDLLLSMLEASEPAGTLRHRDVVRALALMESRDFVGRRLRRPLAARAGKRGDPPARVRLSKPDPVAGGDRARPAVAHESRRPDARRRRRDRRRRRRGGGGGRGGRARRGPPPDGRQRPDGVARHQAAGADGGFLPGADLGDPQAARGRLLRRPLPRIAGVAAGRRRACRGAADRRTAGAGLCARRLPPALSDLSLHPGRHRQRRGIAAARDPRALPGASGGLPRRRGNARMRNARRPAARSRPRRPARERRDGRARRGLQACAGAGRGAETGGRGRRRGAARGGLRTLSAPVPMAGFDRSRGDRRRGRAKSGAPRRARLRLARPERPPAPFRLPRDLRRTIPSPSGRGSRRRWSPRGSTPA